MHLNVARVLPTFQAPITKRDLEKQLEEMSRGFAMTTNSAEGVKSRSNVPFVEGLRYSNI